MVKLSAPAYPAPGWTGTFRETKDVVLGKGLSGPKNSTNCQFLPISVNLRPDLMISNLKISFTLISYKAWPWHGKCNLPVALGAIGKSGP